MKHYKSMPFLSTMNVKRPAQTQIPLLTTFWDGSKWNHPFHESDLVVVNVTSQNRNPYATNQGCSANKKSVGSWERSQKSSRFKTSSNSF